MYVDLDWGEWVRVAEVARERRDEAHRAAFGGYCPQNYDGLVASMNAWDRIGLKASRACGRFWPQMPSGAEEVSHAT